MVGMDVDPPAAESSSHPSSSNLHQDEDIAKSLCVPIRSISSSSSSSNEFVEIFPEEVASITTDQLISLLKDEKAPLSLWTEAALLYMQNKSERESITLLSYACSDLIDKLKFGSSSERVRVHAATGIGYLTQANKSGALLTAGSLGGAAGAVGGGDGGGGFDHHMAQQRAASDKNEELRLLAEKHFTSATKIDQIFPMIWVGRGMLNLTIERLEQAKFFFETTLNTCGQVLPALLGMASVYYKMENYVQSLEMYKKAITLFPNKSGAPARVGLGLASYKLGQVDRAKAAFQRAHDIDCDNVEAMVGIAVLDTAHLDEKLSKDYRTKSENAIRLISMANMIDHSNAMVQNHLANYYFKKWTPVSAVTVNVEKNSDVIKGSGPMNLDIGERIKIGPRFETTIVDEEDNMTFKIKDVWNGESHEGLKLWKKDYERVIALAKGAYDSTTVQEIQAESLFLHARVYHVKDDMDKAHYFYDRACKLAPDLSPARFGLAQTLIWERTHEVAEAELRLVVKKSPSATDAHAALGLLMVKSGKDKKAGFSHLKKAIDLDPSNPDLVLLEALALQQQESDYATALDRYRKATKLMDQRGQSIPWVVSTNMGVLCHETKKYSDAFECYEKAFNSLDKEEYYGATDAKLEDEVDDIRHDDNHMFWKYVDTNSTAKAIQVEEAKHEEKNDSENVWILSEECSYLNVGDHIMIGNEFKSEIETIDGKNIKLQHKYLNEIKDEKSDEDKKEPMKVFVKRCNGRLSHSSAISIAFNFARLHEAVGRIVAAVELHKAIVKRHPSYVNSYLRLACIARDCGSLIDCSEWLKCACAVAPGNPEVLILVGNLHLSLCDWQPAQRVFNQLLEQKIANVDAYSMLCLGNIYFDNLKTPGRYVKHLGYAADFYKRILNRDNANAYAANGIGTVLAEKADLPRAKEVFNRVREISGDTIPDALLNLGHIYLALSKHNEALQMYQSYMDRTNTAGAQVTSKSKDDDDATVLLYIAFAYYDWAKQTESFNNAKAAPADGHYKKCIEFIEGAIKKGKKENVIVRYNICMTKLSAANCILQKENRGIPRTAQEVQEALDGLQESLPKVQTMIQWKKEGKKVPISSSSMLKFIQDCRQNIQSAQTALNDELNKEAEANQRREIQRLEALSKLKQKELEELERKEKEAREQEERERKAMMKMQKVSSLVQEWEMEAQMKEDTKKKKTKGRKGEAKPQAEAGLFDEGSSDEEDGGEESNIGNADTNANEENDENSPNNDNVETKNQPTEEDLFGDDDDDDDDDEDDDEKATEAKQNSIVKKNELFGDSDSDEELLDEKTTEENPAAASKAKQNELFGDSDEDSDEELVSASKRNNEDVKDTETGGPQKKRRVIEEEDSD
mmetsp:Transcript_25660/g.29779  ORF Transcript_25660/g.29779 Transcript_25660/m.29779 type:complete len:1369 (-) Transcript_25660:62-4168(-)